MKLEAAMETSGLIWERRDINFAKELISLADMDGIRGSDDEMRGFSC